MKKILCGIVAAALFGASIAGMGACGAPKTGEAQLAFAGNLQTLYGEAGYPQAVLVAKSSVIESDPSAVAALESYMAGSAAYLASAQPSQIVSLLDGCYEDPDMARSFNAKNLTAEVIANCSVRYQPAAAGKGEILDYVSRVRAMDSAFLTAIPDDSFFWSGTASAAGSEETYTVYAPDGAPALSLANAIANGGNFSYHIVAAAPQQLSALVNGDRKADFCILPLNLAVNLLGSGENYKLLGTVTHGNMFLLSTRTDKPTIKSADDLGLLVGMKIGVVQLPNIPGLTLRLVLEREEVPYKIITETDDVFDDRKVNLIAVDAAAVTLAGDYDYFLCPEPAASAKVKASAQA